MKRCLCCGTEFSGAHCPKCGEASYETLRKPEPRPDPVKREDPARRTGPQRGRQ